MKSLFCVYCKIVFETIKHLKNHYLFDDFLALVSYIDGDFNGTIMDSLRQDRKHRIELKKGKKLIVL